MKKDDLDSTSPALWNPKSKVVRDILLSNYFVFWTGLTFTVFQEAIILSLSRYGFSIEEKILRLKILTAVMSLSFAFLVFAAKKYRVVSIVGFFILVAQIFTLVIVNYFLLRVFSGGLV